MSKDWNEMSEGERQSECEVSPKADIAHDLTIIEDYLSHVDGHDLTHWVSDGEGGTTGIDEGTTDASEAMAALERIRAALSLQPKN